MSKQLFRQEAIDAQREKFFGEATDARPLPMWAFTALAGGVALLVIAVGIWGQYTRRERVEGFLASDTGAARVSFSDAGRIAELLINEGDVVTKGMPMARVSFERATGRTPSTAAVVASELGQRRESLEREQAQIRELGAQQVTQIRRRVLDLQNEMSQLDRESRLQERRLASAREQAQKF
ncbi:MAG: hypothetical protein ING62_10970, partial [Rhodocyclaceae bacterium]|nr:hypothetical protein [Rhodocyclaceae bacterium]